MCRGQYQVTGAVNESSLFLSVCTPEDEHKVFPFVVEGTDCSVGKFFPATALVGAGCMGAYSQGGIEHQYTLFRPKRVRLPLVGMGLPKSACISLKMFCREGGKAIPSFTEKHSP